MMWFTIHELNDCTTYNACALLHGAVVSIIESKSVAPTLTLVSCLAYCLTIKMEVICSSETSADFNGLQGVISQKITSDPP
jgi:hypothetical protein